VLYRSKRRALGLHFRKLRSNDPQAADMMMAADLQALGMRETISQPEHLGHSALLQKVWFEMLRARERRTVTALTDSLVEG